jgi:hypothetical protein
MAKPLTPEDRDFLDRNFARYSEAWRPGLAMLEEHFLIEGVRRWRTLELGLTTRDVFGLRYTLTVGRKNGAMSHTGPALPDGPELTPGERAAVDEALVALGELWLLEPLNSDCRRVDLARGLAALSGEHALRTRRSGSRALLFLSEDEFDQRLCCASVDLDARALERLRWWSLPPGRQGRWLVPEEVAFLDRALRQGGDFGVYGNVTMGLGALAEHFELRIRERERSFSFSVVPRDGHGHFLHFEVDRRTGAVGQPAAGHMDRRPDG